VDNQPPRHSVSVSGITTDDHGRTLLIQRRDNRQRTADGIELAKKVRMNTFRRHPDLPQFS
jgi:hypothetical protein